VNLANEQTDKTLVPHTTPSHCLLVEGRLASCPIWNAIRTSSVSQSIACVLYLSTQQWATQVLSNCARQTTCYIALITFATLQAESVVLFLVVKRCRVEVLAVGEDLLRHLRSFLVQGRVGANQKQLVMPYIFGICFNQCYGGTHSFLTN
jgi:hypothetical protein